MKSILISALFLVVMIGCDNEKPDSGIESNIMLEEPSLKNASAADKVDEGLALIEGADCLTCHKMDEKLVGPSYKEVAMKYENNEANLDKLAEKIVTGGKGNWGEIPMSPHVGMSQENAKKMVKYILTLK